MRHIGEFANTIRDRLEEYLQSSSVTFQGSFSRNDFDAYSDVDLQALIHCALDMPFYVSLEYYLKQCYGPVLLRYAPEYRDNPAEQGLRISFYELPIFWSVDLHIASDAENPAKWPQPFPEPMPGDSALMNLVWAAKHDRRGKAADADRYFLSACEKIEHAPLPYSVANVHALLAVLDQRQDTDPLLVSKVREELFPS
jgi:predicted nucleotidyltransferase